MSNMLGKYIPYASNEAVFELYKYFIPLLIHLKNQSPELALSYMFPGYAQRGNIEEYMTEQQKTDVMKVIEAVLISARNNPQQLPEAQKFEAIMDNIINTNIDNWRSKYGDDLESLFDAFGDVNKLRMTNPDLAANFILDFLSAFTALPPDQSGYALRSLHSGI
ncbi:hypothetical protein V6C53_07145 [Desulfocurvibacter africanus]|uniref:hypothetical protein n=1 Tax=Desulfocurvibacter africanus TaxID=873 RepID=UPI002FD87E80